jgi:hypothetical protein
MSPENRERLKILEERLVQTVLQDANPDYWSGANVQPRNLGQQQRGDAYWCRKMAVASLTVLSKVMHLNSGVYDASAEDELEVQKQIDQATADADRLLDRLQRESGKAAFDRHLNAKDHD